ncbi:M23 family metallopeptidase [Actinoplanes sichuanensis]|uniref:M23 family metallopeptidase n=1 Tax=Actinoplanes sichuanensis TaxID=512349 RepID=A0ABW4AF04_9ACTN|nr:M23 family metallopeptidase [Actinoplanes sichuanensis]BEL11801.1 M23 family metallopeptidase [Actinoplanes sichuanensis]
MPVLATVLLLLPTFWAVPSYQWPVSPPAVLRRFDPPPEPWQAGHRGVDLGVAEGAPVRAAGGGAVVYAGVLAGRGVVSILHAGGLRTTYEPVVAAVRAGDLVAAGDLIGSVAAGHPGCPQAACLHWGLRRGDVYLDPLALLGFGRVRLLPLDPR